MALFSTHYYHHSIEQVISAFGAFFSDMRVKKFNADGTTAQEIHVPIAYGPRNKWLERITAQPDPATGPNVETTMPRLAYEITDYRYDSTRKVGYKGYYTKGVLPNEQYTKVFNPVPYTLNIQLVSFCKDNNTSYQILEQVLPYFSPNVNMSVLMLPEFNLFKDINLTLNSVQTEDTYEGSPDQNRVVMNTFEFNAKIDLFGPVLNKAGIIKNTLAAVGNYDPNYPQQMNDQKVNPLTANQTDTYSITEDWYNLPK